MKMTRTSTTLALPFFLTVGACGGSLREVQGARYELSGKESSVAERYEREEPTTADVSTRCRYWQRRTQDAQGPQTVGILIWQPDAFPNLRQWTDAKSQEVCAVRTKQETQPDGVALTVRVDGTDVVAEAQTKMKCRETRFDSAGQPLRQQSIWHPCDAQALPDAALRLVFADSQEVRATTGSTGEARFKLAGIHLGDDALKPGQAQIVTSTDEHTAVSITALPQYAEWSTAQAKSAEEERQRAKMQDESARLDQVEKDVIALEGWHKAWGDPQVTLLLKNIDLYKSINLTVGDPNTERAGKIGARIDRLGHSPAAMNAARRMDKAATEAQAHAEQAALQIGRRFVLARLKSPSTASFVADAVVLQCPSGTIMTAHDVDAQNGFGAMIRQRSCPKFNPNTRRVYIGPGSAVIDVDCEINFGSMGGAPWTCEHLDDKYWDRYSVPF